MVTSRSPIAISIILQSRSWNSAPPCGSWPKIDSIGSNGEHHVQHDCRPARTLIERARHKTLTARRKAHQKPTGVSSRSQPMRKPQPTADDTALSNEPVQPYAVETWDE